MSTKPSSLKKIAEICAKNGVSPADPLTEKLDIARAKATRYQLMFADPKPDVGGISEHNLRGPNGDVSFRVIYPDHRRSRLPVCVYFHGGGFALNSIDTHDRLIRVLARKSGVAMVAVRYQLAPEAKFPTQLNQGLDVIRVLRKDGAALGLDGDNLALAGDSAGANLALALCLKLKELKLPQPRLSLLFYGMFSANLSTPSHRAFGTGAHGLTTARVDWFWKQYLADFAQRDNPLAAPLWADPKDLGPQFLIAAGLDCLADDSRAMHKRLQQAAVPSELHEFADMPHSFMQMGNVLPEGDQALDLAARRLAEATDLTNSPTRFKAPPLAAE